MRMDDLVSVRRAVHTSQGFTSAFDGSHMVSTRKTYWLFLLLTSGLCKLPPPIVTPYITDILKSQLFPGQTQYFAKTSDSSAAEYIGDDGKWAAGHPNTATL